jgi:hypothetical protein
MIVKGLCQRRTPAAGNAWEEFCCGPASNSIVLLARFVYRDIRASYIKPYFCGTETARSLHISAGVNWWGKLSPG